MSTETMCAPWLLRASVHRLRPDAATGLEHLAAFGVRSVGVQQINQRLRLILQAHAFSGVVAVNVAAVHRYDFAALSSVVGWASIR